MYKKTGGAVTSAPIPHNNVHWKMRNYLIRCRVSYNQCPKLTCGRVNQNTRCDWRVNSNSTPG